MVKKINKIGNTNQKKKPQQSKLLLGKKTSYLFDNPQFSSLHAIVNPHQDVDYVVRFSCPEFTSICPITSQPDFAHIIVDYLPDKKIVESKSLKLYLFSFRNHGAYHEDCTVKIAKDIIKTIQPKWLRISGYWFPRGGIPIDIFFQTSTPPSTIFIGNNPSYDYKAR
ncbi:MAG: preQ(1) synthase [Alphaproteobacteria bacterium]